jgi:hypothetical protein
MEVNSHQRISQLLEGYDGTAERLDKILHEYGRVGDKVCKVENRKGLMSF